MSPTSVIMRIIDFIFDNLFILIIFASFILPLFRRNSKKAPSKPAQQRPATNQQSTQTTTQPVIVEADDDFAKRLEEARKRVQSAMGDNAQTEAKLPSQPQTSLPTAYSVPQLGQQTSTSRPLVNPVQQATPSQTQMRQRSAQSRTMLGQDGRAEHPLFNADHSSSFLPSESVTSTSMLREEQAPLQVSKRKAAKKAKRKADRLLAFDEKSIARGFVWHYILSEPKSKEGRNHSRRKAFQHQS